MYRRRGRWNPFTRSRAGDPHRDKRPNRFDPTTHPDQMRYFQAAAQRDFKRRTRKAGRNELILSIVILLAVIFIVLGKLLGFSA